MGQREQCHQLTSIYSEERENRGTNIIISFQFHVCYILLLSCISFALGVASLSPGDIIIESVAHLLKYRMKSSSEYQQASSCYLFSGQSIHLHKACATCECKAIAVRCTHCNFIVKWTSTPIVYIDLNLLVFGILRNLIVLIYRHLQLGIDSRLNLV